ncbi:MAG: hypothetical protein A9183_07175 [Dehalococcoides mccartyi]|uniref:BREX-3 system P-loop-containing protein BrxF n=1 Tax=Dehalococcoides mccartyi TaxID=61435 RepID=UPI0008059545|nr:BREX-3 system P-loop-containing protein BrxF [Dehalococcoides mccartyi]OBW63496.1 MAG: hypothetical protein A9183_07175 [Dehalococcoides mccartyi]
MASETIINRILDYLEHIEDLTYKLIIIAAPSGSGKTAIIQDLSKTKNYPLINVNLQLADRLKDLSKTQRSLRVDQILGEILAEHGNTPVLLDNIEILFDFNLKINPLSLLQKLSRNRPIITTWNGVVDGNRLSYAQRGHAEYGNYDLDDTIVISME